MDYLLWIIIIACFILSFVALVYPILPGILFLWGGVAVYHFFIESSITWWTWGTLILITILLFLVDFAANHYFVQKYGGTKWGSRAATTGIILGCFIIPPFGVIIIPFILVLIAEIVQGRDFMDALKVGLGTLIAFLSGTFAKALLQIVLIIIFLLNIFLV